MYINTSNYSISYLIFSEWEFVHENNRFRAFTFLSNEGVCHVLDIRKLVRQTSFVGLRVLNRTALSTREIVE